MPFWLKGALLITLPKFPSPLQGIYPAVLGVVVKLTITGVATFRANLEKLR